MEGEGEEKPQRRKKKTSREGIDGGEDRCMGRKLVIYYCACMCFL